MSAVNLDVYPYRIVCPSLNEDGQRSLLDTAYRVIQHTPQGERMKFCYPANDVKQTAPITVQRWYFATWHLDNQVIVTDQEHREVARGTCDAVNHEEVAK